MRFLTLPLCLFAALAAAASNPFNVPAGGYQFSANTPTTLSWQATTQGTVTLKLQSGGVTSSSSGTTIAANIANSGSFTWTPPSNLPAGSDYTIEIIDDADPSEYNFTPQFSISGVSGTVTSSLASSLVSSTTLSSIASSTVSSTVSSTISSTMSSTMSTSSTSAVPSSSPTSTITASSSPASSTTTSSSSTSTTTTSSSPSAVTTTVPNTKNAGMRVTVSAGMLAVVMAVMVVM